MNKLVSLWFAWVAQIAFFKSALTVGDCTCITAVLKRVQAFGSLVLRQLVTWSTCSRFNCVVVVCSTFYAVSSVLRPFCNNQPLSSNAYFSNQTKSRKSHAWEIYHPLARSPRALLNTSKLTCSPFTRDHESSGCFQRARPTGPELLAPRNNQRSNRFP